MTTSFLLLASAGTGYALLNYYDGNINRLEGVFGDKAPVRTDADNPQNILIVGSDSRDGLVGEEAFQGEGDEFVTGQRSDTIILAHLYGSVDAVQLISFPRDAFVTIPAHTDSGSGERVRARESRINNALADGGPALLVDTIEQLTALTVNHYVQVDFSGFKDMVDRLGGVDVCLPEAERDRASGLDLPAGISTVQGDQALAFVRQREGLARGDVDRIGRQQQFIGSLVNKVLSAGTLANPLRLNGFLDTATSSLDVDEGLDLGTLRDLALRLRSFSADDIVFTTAPIEDLAGNVGGASVVLLDEAAGQQLYDGLRRDVPPGQPTAPQVQGPPLIVTPENVVVEVFNGTATAGLGSRAADDLEEVGFAVAGPPGNRGAAATTTTVVHGPDRADSARTLAAAVPGTTIELDPSLGRSLELVVGSSYDGAQPVTVAGQEEPAPPSNEPEARTAAQNPCA